jgi:hypothetical protein
LIAFGLFLNFSWLTVLSCKTADVSSVYSENVLFEKLEYRDYVRSPELSEKLFALMRLLIANESQISKNIFRLKQFYCDSAKGLCRIFNTDEKVLELNLEQSKIALQVLGDILGLDQQLALNQLECTKPQDSRAIFGAHCTYNRFPVPLRPVPAQKEYREVIQFDLARRLYDFFPKSLLNSSENDSWWEIEKLKCDRQDSEVDLINCKLSVGESLIKESSLNWLVLTNVLTEAEILYFSRISYELEKLSCHKFLKSEIYYCRISYIDQSHKQKSLVVSKSLEGEKAREFLDLMQVNEANNLQKVKNNSNSNILKIDQINCQTTSLIEQQCAMRYIKNMDRSTTEFADFFRFFDSLPLSAQSPYIKNLHCIRSRQGGKLRHSCSFDSPNNQHSRSDLEENTEKYFGNYYDNTKEAAQFLTALTELGMPSYQERDHLSFFIENIKCDFTDKAIENCQLTFLSDFSSYRNYEAAKRLLAVLANSSEQKRIEVLNLNCEIDKLKCLYVLVKEP